MDETTPVEGGSEIEAAKKQKAKAPEKERQGPQYEGDVNAYKRDRRNWPFLQHVAKDYGWDFRWDGKDEAAVVIADNIPAAQLRQAVTIAELYKAGRLR